MLTSMESDEGFVVGKIKHIREQYSVEQVAHDSTRQGREDFAAQLWSTMNQNQDKTNTVPMFKPWDSGKADMIAPSPKGEFEGLGYRTGSAEPMPYGKVYLAEVISKGSPWDQPIATEIDEQVRALVGTAFKIQLHSEMTMDNTTIPVGNSGTMEVLLGRQELQRLLTEREAMQDKPKKLESHLFI